MTKSFLATLLTSALLLSPAACGEGYDTPDAEAECDRIREDVRTCFDSSLPRSSDPTFRTCVSCFESCGNECFVDNCSFTCD